MNIKIEITYIIFEKCRNHIKMISLQNGSNPSIQLYQKGDRYSYSTNLNINEVNNTFKSNSFSKERIIYGGFKYFYNNSKIPITSERNIIRLYKKYNDWEKVENNTIRYLRDKKINSIFKKKRNAQFAFLKIVSMMDLETTS